jgi:hypothetical protein
VAAAGQVFHELVELNTDALEDSSWTALYQSLEQLQRPLNLNGRLYLSDSGSYILDSSLYKLADAQLLINHRHDLATRRDDLSLRLGLKTGRLEAVLGSYRFRFGRGILTGGSIRGIPDSLFSLDRANSPADYTQLGAGMIYNYRALRAAAFGSMQKREAYLEDGAILSLPASRRGLLTSARENIFGVSAGVYTPVFQSAAIFYWQEYDKPFADASLEQRLWAAGLYAAMDLPANRISAELALAAGEPGILASWQFKLRNFKQVVSYGRNTNSSLLSYAINPALLNPAKGRDEITYQMQVALPFHTSLQILYALNSGSGFTGGNLARFQASAAFQNGENLLRLTFHSFDREIITFVDSTYSAASPQNYRVLLTGRYHLKPNFFQQLDLAYTLQDKEDYTQNTYRAGFILGYAYRSLDLKAGIQTWQSPREFLFEDDLNPYYYSICKSEDTALTASASLKQKRWYLSLQGRKSLLEEKDFNVKLQLGLSLL